MWLPVVKMIAIFSYGYQINRLLTKLYGTKQTYETSLADSGCNSGLYNSHDLSFLLFPFPSPLPSPLLHGHTRLWRLGVSFPFSAVANSYFFILPSSSYMQGHRREMLKVCGSLFSSVFMGKISGNNFSGFRQLPVHYLQFSCWYDMCITFRFFRQLHHVIWYIHNICNVIHKASHGILHTSIFTAPQNTKTCL